MATIAALNATDRQFGFTLHTSSGDTIELSMYDNQSVAFSQKTEGGVRTTTMSLRHEYGYRFYYKGDGIDPQDQKEIEEAMKKIRPLFQNFLKSVEKSDRLPGIEETTNIAQLLRGELPSPESTDAQNLLKDRTVDTVDELLALFDASERLLESAKALFDKLFDTTRRFDFYA